MSSTHLPLAAKAKLVSILPALALGIRLPAELRIGLPGGPVFLGRRSAYIDLITVLDVWNVDMFPADCAGRMVLDVGAHKGYFGAWALAQGAAFVVSCEPERSNFALLERSRRANARRDAWHLEPVAVGDRVGTAPLYVSAESWAHSLYQDMIESVAVETVRLTTLTDILERALASHPNLDVVLKLNVEGAAGSIILPMDRAALAPIVEIHLDHEPNSPYVLAEVLEHLAQAGLDEVDDRGTVRLLQIRRGPPPSRSD
jgi:FkbM family methyltransferase